MSQKVQVDDLRHPTHLNICHIAILPGVLDNRRPTLFETVLCCRKRTQGSSGTGYRTSLGHHGLSKCQPDSEFDSEDAIRASLLLFWNTGYNVTQVCQDKFQDV